MFIRSVYISMLFFAFSLAANSKEQSYKLTKVFEGQGVIWGFEFLPDSNILFTEREGSLKLFNSKTKSFKTIANSPKVHSGGQAGLLDIIIDSDFTKNQTLFLTYSKKVADNYTTAVYRAKLEKGSLTEGKDIFVAKTDSSKSVHYGSRIRESKDGNLFVSIGDRGQRDKAQELTNHNGTVLRITKDGKPAKGNPFLNNKSALDEIWSYGHRNPQGMDYHMSTDTLWVNEHGPRGGDEINLVLAGKNYGWPVITYGKEYWGPSIGEGVKKQGMEQPIYQYTPSIAPSGLVTYKGEMFPEWQGNFISGALKLTHINRLFKKGTSWSEDKLKKVADLDERIRSVKEAPDGSIYFGTDSGKLFRIHK